MKEDMIKRLFTSLMVLLASLPMLAQGWPTVFDGVMLQGFYWDSYDATKWTTLEAQADELAKYFKLVWLPQSGQCKGTGQSMGYDDYYWFPGHYNSSFGTEGELRSLITTFKAKGIGTIADVVVNHRKETDNWVEFPQETYKGVTYQLTSKDVCANDDGGATKTWATANGYELSSQNDTGEGWDGKTNVKAYLKMLLEDLGYVGFRYDMVKGYAAPYTKLYNEYAAPTYSVGECFDGNLTKVKNWINGTGKTSAAFDFPFRYTVRDAINNNDWRKLAGSSLASGDYSRYSVTFVENHDTERRSGAEQDPIKKDTLAANAYMLAMPGTPCVFLTHWRDCKQDIKAMIDVRKQVRITNQSEAINLASSSSYYVVQTQGVLGKLLCVVGPGASTYTRSGFTKVISGYKYAYWLNNDMNTAWVDKADGEYVNEVEVMLSAVTSDSGAQLVYTTDGSTPTASNGKKVASGAKVKFTETTTLKVGLLIGGSVSGIVTRNFTISTPQIITVYVNTDNVGWSTVNYWTWGGDGSHAPKNSSWPGDKVTDKKTIKGKQWYYKEFSMHGSDDFVNFVFSTGSGSPQTIDINNINADTFFEISTEKEGSKNKVKDVTSEYTGVEGVKVDNDADPAYYDLQGRRVLNPNRGLYIVKGRKVLYTK